jgi:GNAT superfamily N-acetyltransferase
MFTLAHLDTPPPESMKSQVLQMVVDYLSDISPVSLTPSNPLYQLYQYVVGFEVHRYLDSMDGAQVGKPKLIMALDAEDPASLLGFALYLPYVDDTDACTLAYLAVQASHRRLGIGRAMVEAMVSAYPHAGVACVASKVPYFEALAFCPCQHVARRS